jgi:hypothetical protein
MVKGKKTYGWCGVLIALLMVSTYAVSGQVMEKGADEAKARADMVTIDTLKVFGYLEKPAVVFMHDLHTDALEKKGKDCLACHLPQSNRIPGTFTEAVKGIDPLSPKFKRLEDTAREEVMDVYHKFCIECHTDMSAAGDKTGPVTCGECHKGADVASSRQLIGMDKSLHFRHSRSQEKKCERCHHKYDAENKKLIYDKEKEGTCRYCHLNEGEGVPVYADDPTQISKLTMKNAAHLDCISCHRRTLAQNKVAGPVKCSGCHDPELQKKIQKVKAEEIVRVERKQPDVVMVKTGKIETEDGKLGPVRMNPVAYDHKAHETYNDTCRVCHHASMESCGTCHTITGAKKGNFVKLEHSFHLINSEKGCLGCHETQKEDPRCLGCHVFMEKSRKQADESCLKCHEKMTPEMEEQLKTADDKLLVQMAENMVKNRTYIADTIKDEDIPEKVVIDVVKTMSSEDKYEAVELPHRKIVRKLVDNIKDNKLATYFHREKTMMCQGCHHNTPLSAKPPRCSTCHGKPFNEKEMLRPGLMGAYHQQCMTCHQEMGLEKPAGCTGCHKEKK